VLAGLAAHQGYPELTGVIFAAFLLLNAQLVKDSNITGN